MAFVMIAGGNDTTTGLLAGAAELLTRYPDQRRRLLDDPSLIPERGRRVAAAHVTGAGAVPRRDARRRGRRYDGGRRRPGAALLRIGQPRRARVRRRRRGARRGRAIDRLLTFSVGSHYCLGAAATRLQGRIVLEELLRALPDFTVDAASGVFADGGFTRRYESLPFDAGST